MAWPNGPNVTSTSQVASSTALRSPAIPTQYETPSNPFPYPGRPIGPNQIRTVRIAPAKLGEHINTELVTVSLRSGVHDYEALSYTWGAWTQKRTISVNGEDGFHVTDNVFNALQRLRSKRKPRELWIDAICINQNDRVERNQQLQVIGEVYRHAHAVLIWLGDADDAKIPWRCHLEGRLQFKEFFTHLETHSLAFALLTSEPHWWDRIWVVQEYALAGPEPTICFGSCRVPLSRFNVAMKNYFLTTNSDVLNDSLQSSRHVAYVVYSELARRLPWSNRVAEFGDIGGPLDAFTWAGKILLIKLLTGAGHLLFGDVLPTSVQNEQATLVKYNEALNSLLLRLEAFGAQRERPSGNDLADVAWRMRDLQATDPRDKVYSLLGMLRPETARRLSPDVAASPADIFSLATYTALLESPDTDPYRILRLVTIGNQRADKVPWKNGSRKDRTHGLPSWAVDFLFPGAFAWNSDQWSRFEPSEPSSSVSTRSRVSLIHKHLTLPRCLQIGHVSQVCKVPLPLLDSSYSALYQQLAQMLEKLPRGSPYFAAFGLSDPARITSTDQSPGLAIYSATELGQLESVDLASLNSSTIREGPHKLAFQLWDHAYLPDKTKEASYARHQGYTLLPNGHIESARAPSLIDSSWNPHNPAYGRRIKNFTDDIRMLVGCCAVIAVDTGFVGLANGFVQNGDAVVMVRDDPAEFIIVRPKQGGVGEFLGFAFMHGLMRAEVAELRDLGYDWEDRRNDVVLC